MTFDLLNSLMLDLTICSINKTVFVDKPLVASDYARVKSVLSSIGGVWSTTHQHFTFKKNPKELISRVVSNCGRSINTFQFYPTPVEIFEYISKHTDLSFIGSYSGSVSVLEPSCGEGVGIEFLGRLGCSTGREFIVNGYEIDPLNHLICEEKGFDVELKDFLEVEPVAKYDLVLMNPPFKGLTYIKHLQHAQKFLNPQGVIISVVPANWLSNPLGKPQTKWLLEHAQVHDRINSGDCFPKGTFDGVSWETMVVTISSAEYMTDRINNSYRFASDLEEMSAAIACVDSYSAKASRILSSPNMSFGEKRSALEAAIKEVMNTPSEALNYYHQYSEQFIEMMVAEALPEPTLLDLLNRDMGLAA